MEYLESRDILTPQQTAIKELFVPADKAAAAAAEAATLPQLAMDTVSLQWTQVLAEGWASPLNGFMREKEFLQALHFNSLRVNGKVVNQSVPIVLPATAEDKARLAAAPAIALTYEGKSVAILRSPEFFEARKEERCSRQFGIDNVGHPYIHLVHSYGDFLVGGDLEVLERIVWNDGLDEYRLTPRQLRQEFVKRGADAIFAFQLRNPIHNVSVRLCSFALFRGSFFF